MKNFIFWIIFLISLSGIQIAIFPGPTVRTILEFILNFIVGIILLSYYKIIFKKNIPSKYLIYSYILYSITVFIHSAIISRNYEQWRYLFTVYTPFLLLPSFIYICSTPKNTYWVLKTLKTITIPLSFTFFLLSDMFHDENVFYVKYISFIYIFILLLPYFRVKTKILIVIISLLSLFFNLENRTNILCIVSSYILGISFFFVRSLWIKKIARYIFLFLPLFFLSMGALGIFNIFKVLDGESSWNIESGNKEISLTSDSRTTIYNDAFKNLSSKKAWILGVGVTDVYKTDLSDVLSFFDKGRLGASESAFLNFLSYGGILFVFIVFILFYRVSYLAIYNSNNSLVCILGVYMSLQWLLLFIENPIDINFYWISLFCVFGICISPIFRKMNNQQIVSFLRKI